MALAGALLLPAVAPRVGRAAWAPFGNPIIDEPHGQVHPVIATDGADGAIIAWQDQRSSRQNIFAQHVRADGVVDPAWPRQGRALLGDSLGIATADGGQFTPIIVSDGTGGAIVAWQDLRDAATGIDLYAQHVLASGELDPKWPANGLPVVTARSTQNFAAIVTDGAGGAVLTWVDGRAGINEFDIFAQRVRGDGETDPAWPVDGLAVCALPGAQGFPGLVDDGAGGALIAWHDLRAGSLGFDVYAQHVLGSGVLDAFWPANGLAVVTAVGDQGNPAITRDGPPSPTGRTGAIVAWTDTRTTGDPHIFAQHVLDIGIVDDAWPVDGRRISSAGTLETRALVVPDGVGGAVVSWQALAPHLNEFAQHVTSGGTVDPGWPAGGRALSPTTRQESFADMVPDGRGGAIVAWEDSANVVAQHVLASGLLDPAYPDTGRQIVPLPSRQGDVALVATSGQGAIATWVDGRSGTDIFALQVQEAGTVSVPPGAVPAGITPLRASPNPARSTFTLRFALPRASQVGLTIFDLNGRRVRELAAGPLVAGVHEITWDRRADDGRSADAGLYLARLEIEGRASTTKLIALGSAR